MKIRYVIVVAIIVLLSISILNGCVKSPSLEEDATIISQSLSPDNTFKATAFIKQDTIDHADIYKVSLSSNKGSNQNEHIIYVGDCIQSIEVYWQDNCNLLISINENDIGSNTFKSQTSAGNIKIAYQINTQSPRREFFEHPIIAEKSVIVWNEGKFQIVKSADKNNFIVHDENGEEIILLENVTKYKWQNSKLYLEANNGYAIADRHDVCALCIEGSVKEIYDAINGVTFVESYDSYTNSDKLIFEQM